VELHTQHLHIADDEEEDGSDNRLVIEGSRLLGQDGAGLLVGFLGTNDHVSIRHSTLDYPMAVGISVFMEGPPASSVELVDVVLRAQDEASEVGVVTHDLRFENVTIDTPSETLVMAEHCVGHDITGARLVCRSSGP